MSNKFNIKKIIIGTANFGQNYGLKNKKINQKEISKIINYAHKKKIVLFDTAMNYGNSDKIIGKFKNKNSKIITKINIEDKNLLNLDKYLHNKILRSLRNSNITKLHGVLLHRPEDLLSEKGGKIYKALIKLKKKKIVEKIGVSIYKFRQIKSILKKYKIDIVQLPFNLLDRRLINKKNFDILKKNKIEIHIRSIFLKGLLLKTTIPEKFKKWNFVWKKIRKFNKENLTNNLSICIQFIKQHSSYFDKVIIGIDNVDQIKKIVNEFSSKKENKFPNIVSNNQKLINPSLW